MRIYFPRVMRVVIDGYSSNFEYPQNMKQLIVLFLIASSSAVMAQGKLGITGGVQAAGLHSKDNLNNFPDTRIGFRVGGLYEHPLTEKFGIRQELSYSLAGGKGGDSRLDLSYLSMPILGYYKPVKDVYFYLGPELNFFIAKSASGSVRNSKEFKPVDFGISFGMEYRITEYIGVSMRNYFGLIHASELKLSRSIQPDDVLLEPDKAIKFNRNNIFQLSVSYYIDR